MAVRKATKNPPRYCCIQLSDWSSKLMNSFSFHLEFILNSLSISNNFIGFSESKKPKFRKGGFRIKRRGNVCSTILFFLAN